MKKISKSIIPFILAIGPILDPYILFNIGSVEIKVMDILIICCAGLVLLKEKRLKINFSLFLIIVSIFTLNLLSFVVYSPNRDFLITMKVIMVWALYVILLSVLWQTYNKEKFVEYTIKIAYIGAIFIIIQFVCLNLGINQIWDGKLPLLQLSKYDGWARMIDITGVIRVHSVFQEPSYVAMYLLPVIAYTLKIGKYFCSGILMLAALLSTSSVAVMGIAVVIIYYIWTLPKQYIPAKRKKKFLMYIIFSGMILIMLYSFSSDIREIINYSIEKVSLIFEDLKSERMGSTKIRILGNIDYFLNYPIWYKIFGVGINQYPNYLNDVIPYSSTIVTFILNYGIIGFIVLITYFISNLLRTKGYMKVFAIIFIMYCSIDLFWFNWYFFYVITWMEIYTSKSREKYFTVK